MYCTYSTCVVLIGEITTDGEHDNTAPIKVRCKASMINRSYADLSQAGWFWILEDCTWSARPAILHWVSCGNTPGKLLTISRICGSTFGDIWTKISSSRDLSFAFGSENARTIYWYTELLGVTTSMISSCSLGTIYWFIFRNLFKIKSYLGILPTEAEAQDHGCKSFLYLPMFLTVLGFENVTQNF